VIIKLLIFAIEIVDELLIELGYLLTSLVDEGKSCFYDDLVLKEVFSKG
jgi:hypothetical protein